MFDPYLNIATAADIMKGYMADCTNEGLVGAFKKFSGAECSSNDETANQQADIAMKLYQTCLAENS